jgi:hypothetical protein
MYQLCVFSLPCQELTVSSFVGCHRILRAFQLKTQEQESLQQKTSSKIQKFPLEIVKTDIVTVMLFTSACFPTLDFFIFSCSTKYKTKPKLTKHNVIAVISKYEPHDVEESNFEYTNFANDIL